MDFLRDVAKLSEAQIEPLRSMHDFRFTLMGGASGAGKTRVLVAGMAYLNMLCAAAGMPPHRIRTALASADMSRIIARFVKEVDDVLINPGYGRLYGATKDAPPAFKFNDPRLGEIHFMSLWDIKDPRGTEKLGIAIDELTEIPEELFQEVNWRLRYFGEDFPLNDVPILAATNSDGPYSHWVAEYFVSKTFNTPRGKNFGAQYADQMNYIPMSLEDNPNRKAAEEYTKVLESFPDDLRQARLEGKWGISTDARFPYKPNIVKPFSIPPHWERWCGIDWGYGHRSLAAVWLAFEPETADAYCYRVLKGGNLSVVQAAEAIGRLSAEDNARSGGQVQYLGDPTILSHREPLKMQKLDVYFREAGVRIRPGAKSPLSKNIAVERYMAPKTKESEDEEKQRHEVCDASVYFFEGECDELLTDLAAVRYNLRDKNPEKLVPHEHTHTVYALGYVLATAWPSKARVEEEKDPRWQKLKTVAQARAIKQAGMPLTGKYKRALQEYKKAQRGVL